MKTVLVLIAVSLLSACAANNPYPAGSHQAAQYSACRFNAKFVSSSLAGRRTVNPSQDPDFFKDGTLVVEKSGLLTISDRKRIADEIRDCAAGI